MDLWKTSLISTVDNEQVTPVLIVVSVSNALDQIDVKNVVMFLEKRMAFSK